ncbi:MAG: hypothetical protein ACRESZ_11720 [Methylococcales bacterium]
MNSEAAGLKTNLDLLACLRKTKTNPELIQMLERAKERKITEEELQEQRASFVYGSLSVKNNTTKDEVKKFLAAHDCK